jgi:hypothetical protein
MSEIDRQSARFRYCLPKRPKLLATPVEITPPLNEYGGPCWRCGKPDARRLTHVDGNLVWVCRQPSRLKFNEQEVTIKYGSDWCRYCGQPATPTDTFELFSGFRLHEACLQKWKIVSAKKRGSSP